MTATSYVDLDNDDLGANKILRAATMSALDTNPLSIAQRGPSAPWLNGVGAITKLTSGSGNWTVPAGVYRIKVMAVGGGASTSAIGSNGSNTTFSTLTASGGNSNSAGGSASGGDVNITGGNGGYYYLYGGYMFGVADGGSSTLGGGGQQNQGGSTAGSGYGSGGGHDDPVGVGNVYGGGAGGTSIKIFSVEPGDLMAYSVGAGGGSGSGSGAPGIIIIEY